MGVHCNTLACRFVYLPMRKPRPQRYSIEIKDAKGQSLLFAAADWNKDDLRVAVARILRLDGVIEPLLFSEPGSSSGKE